MESAREVRVGPGASTRSFQCTATIRAPTFALDESAGADGEQEDDHEATKVEQRAHTVREAMY